MNKTASVCGMAVVMISLLLGLIVVVPDVQGIAVYAHVLNWPPCSFDEPNSSPSAAESSAAAAFRSVIDKLSVMAEDVLPELGGNIKLYSGVGPQINARNISMGPLNGWHITPTSLKTEGVTTVLYLHGNGGNRATAHRVELYKILASMGMQVVAFDYRGFGDNTGWPNQEGVVQDARDMWQYIIDNATGLGVKPEQVLVWGHSLGTAVSVALVHSLMMESHAYLEATNPQFEPPLPGGLLLESPFTSILDLVLDWCSAVGTFLPSRPTLARLLRPYIHHQFDSAALIQDIVQGKAVETDGVVRTTQTVPTMIMHGKLDNVVPHELGLRLYEIAREGNSTGSRLPPIIDFCSFDEAGHDWMVREAGFEASTQHWLGKVDERVSSRVSRAERSPTKPLAIKLIV